MAIRVVIIDDNITSPVVLKKTVEMYRITESREDLVSIDLSEEPTFDTHSDICCKIIMKNFKDIEFINIIIKEPNRSGRIDYLVRALLLANQRHPDIVHMSVGTTTYNMVISLFKAVRKLVKKSVVIAATSNDGKLTFPACFPKVFSCRAAVNDRMKGRKVAINAEQFIRNNYGSIMKIPNDNSFAAAVFSGQMAEKLSKRFE